MRVRASSADCRLALAQNWTFASVPAGSVASPGRELDSIQFEPAAVPGTVASTLHDLKRLDWSHPPELDAFDHWYRCPLPKVEEEGRRVLAFDGLATLADIWVGARHVLSTNNMYRRYEVDVTEALAQGDTTLTVRFASLSAALRERRPRPRYRTRLVDDQQLRWFRTTLIGRTPGFCPRIAPVGPYRGIWLETRRRWKQIEVLWSSRLDAGPERRDEADAQICVDVVLGGLDKPVRAANLFVDGPGGEKKIAMAMHGEALDSDKVRVSTSTTLPSVALWWPHTHGPQPLYRARLHLEFDGVDEHVDLGKVGFRRIARTDDGGRFGLAINGVPIFCRGACWSTENVLTPGSRLEPRGTLELARKAGMNMLRVGGTMVYESDAFFDVCDELGLLVWQDFMFANMDYPAHDPEFSESVHKEAEQVLSDLQSHACVAVLCGGSEVEQQASMLGLPREQWDNSIFSEMLPGLCHERLPEVPYLPSTPCGGALPFHTSEGVTHYYGVGAYRRPFCDVRASSVAFASECLAFANVPEESMLTAFLPDLATAPHHPRWKERVPRDRGVGWDFDDIRDHYVKELFGVDPVDVRYSDVNRYLAMGRVASAEVMERVISEWRRPASGCFGALVWLLKDFWPGAGWGVVDAQGTPKAAYHALARVFCPTALLFTDEGLNGYALHAVNDTPHPIDANVRVAAFRDGFAPIAGGESKVVLPANDGVTLSVDGVLGRFYDLTHAYRFGPPSCDIVAGWLEGDDGATLGRAFAFPTGLPNAVRDDVGLSAYFAEDGTAVHVATKRFALAVRLEVPGSTPGDQYFHLAPGERRRVPLSSPASPGSAWVGAMNVGAASRILSKPPEENDGGSGRG